MHFTTTAFAAASLAVQQTLAFGGRYGGGSVGGYGGGWEGNSQFSTPDNTNNECTPAQASGYDWSGLKPGPFSRYGSNTFSGWSCSNSFGKRDLLGKRTFRSKCITAPLDDSPSIGCEGDSTMSLDKFQISSNKDTDVECHYSMPDGSTCKETHSCSAGGSEIQNSQCGGAKSVTFKPAGDNDSGCMIGVHSVGFNCGPASSTPPTHSSSAPPSYSTPSIPTYDSWTTSSASIPQYSSSSVETSSVGYPSSTPSAHGYSSRTAPAYSSSSSESLPVRASPSISAYSTPSSSGSPSISPSVHVNSTSSTPSYNTTSSPVGRAPGYTIPPYSGSSSLDVSSKLSSILYSPSAVYTTTLETLTCALNVPDCLVKSGSSAVVTETVAISTTIWPVAVAETSPVLQTSSIAQPLPPNTLPKCLNSWLYLTSCKDNSDYDCFCRDSEFIIKVMGCLSSWSKSHEDTQGSASYLIGLCAPYVPQNPAIITACPSSVTPAASYSYSPETSVAPTSQTQGQTSTLCRTKEAQYSNTAVAPVDTLPTLTSVASAPCTTITYSTVFPVPATYSTGKSQGYTIPSSSIITTHLTTVTVPQVQVTTYTVTTRGFTATQRGLGYGAPTLTIARAPAGPTEALGYSASSAPASAPYLVTSIPGSVGAARPAGLGTIYLPSSSPSGSSITPYTGAATKLIRLRFALIAVACGALLL